MRVDKTVAIALKDIGYNVPCCDFFEIPDNALIELGYPEEGLLYRWGQSRYDYNSVEGNTSLPHIYEVCTWLRDTHGLHCYATPYFYSTTEVNHWYPQGTDLKTGLGLPIENGMYNDYPEALHAAVSAAVQIIKEKGL